MRQRTKECLDGELIIAWELGENTDLTTIKDYERRVAMTNRREGTSESHGHVIRLICEFLASREGAQTDRQIYAVLEGYTWEDYESAIATALGCGFILGYVYLAGA